MAVPDKDALIGPTVTEAQFKTNLGAIVDFIKPIETQSPTYATTALLTATKPTDNQAYAKALDTGKVWFWYKPAGSPEGNYWTETRLSDLDKAETQIKEYVGRSISTVMPVVVDEKGNSPLWLRGGLLGFPSLDAGTQERVKVQMGLASFQSLKFTPIIVDENGNSPLWLENGYLGFGGLTAGAIAIIKAQIDQHQSIKPTNNVTNAAYSIVSDSASLRQFKAKASKLKSGITQQLRLVMTGDSWTEHNTISNELLTLLRSKYGEAGTGWINLGIESNQLDGVTCARSGAWVYRDLDQSLSFPNGSPPDGFVLSGSTTDCLINVGNLTKGDKFTVFFGKSTGVFSYKLNGGAAVEVTVNASGSTVQSIEIPLSTTSSFEFAVVSGTVHFFGFHLRKSTGSGVELNKLGNGSSTGQDWKIISPTSQSNFADFLKPDVVVIILGTNDYRKGHSVANFKAGISSIIDGYRTNNPNCGVILIAPARTNTTFVIPLYEYRDAIYEIAQEKKAEFYNMYDDWDLYNPEYDNAMWSDSLHVSKSGAYRIATKIFKTFLEI